LPQPRTISTQDIDAITQRTDVADSSISLDREFQRILSGGGRLDYFIRRQSNAAQAGNADSMHYLSEAMGKCSRVLYEVESTMQFSSIQFGNPLSPAEHDWNYYREYIMGFAIQTTEFVKAQMLLNLKLAEQCSSLGLSTDALLQGHGVWQAAATAAGQPIALAWAAAENVEDLSPADLRHSKDTIREVLRENRQLETLLHAATVSILATGREPVAERLAWAVLGCDYYDCEGSLNHLYRVDCAIASRDGAFYCQEGMSDADYLYGKYPGQIDIARGRAMEIRAAIDGDRWDMLGLE
jgi:hypothetical protein